MIPQSTPMTLKGRRKNRRCSLFLKAIILWGIILGLVLMIIRSIETWAEL